MRREVTPTRIVRALADVGRAEALGTTMTSAASSQASSRAFIPVKGVRLISLRQKEETESELLLQCPTGSESSRALLRKDIPAVAGGIELAVGHFPPQSPVSPGPAARRPVLRQETRQ
jgi:hypothetical protein